ncbi:metal-dependent hydrolase family protein [Pseudokineococcus sp. 1T1Z-3]|uniref:metal-dependent hydrolase family protein n=1 Tax=Pseudokineococcus sp. 1T1Z-3 TaxID=3132745 RepID=UPI0030ACBDB7
MTTAVADSPSTPLLVTEGRVLDVATGTYSGATRVLVEDGRITSVGGEEVRGPEGVEVLDAGGRTVMPGLVDAHVHVTAATADLFAQAEWAPSYVTAHATQILAGMLERGFTSVRDVGGADHGLAAAVEEGLLRGPRLFFGGKALSQTGGHGDGRPPGRSSHVGTPCGAGIGAVVDGPEAFRLAAREQLRTGAHHIKIMLSGGVASPTDRIDSTQSSEAEIRAVVEEATAQNRYVTGHAYTSRSVERALRLGVRCIEHGNLVDDACLELFLQHGAFLVPTLVTYQHLASEGAEHGLPADSVAKVASVLEAGLDTVDRATRAGVDVVLGTDLLGGMHRHQSEEIALRAQVQTPAQVLASATTTAARLLQREGEIGVLAPGAYGDLLVVEGDPLADVTVLARPEETLRAVVKDGRVVHRGG